MRKVNKLFSIFLLNYYLINKFEFYRNNKNKNLKQIISSSNSDFPMNSNSNFQINNIPQKFENILEPIFPEEMNPEILNMSKVKDGFFIGDRISAISIEVITEFKISY